MQLNATIMNYKQFIYDFVLIFLLLSEPCIQCGPGRGSGWRKRNRKMTPLVFKQHVPNVSENTLGGSGPADGRITRKDKLFKDLVVNENTDIVFKDEEGTGEDHIMTQRCKDKLNSLAIAVMNQWPGVKLRVTEAWDENGHHASDSLHYEGRAVDITTSDRDRAKYGMLARLAVEAGFDWVYYEQRGHIHCSVKSESSAAMGFGGCFPGSSYVTTDDGKRKRLSETQVGDRVLTVSADGSLKYTTVILFIDRDPNKTAAFYNLHTEANITVTLTSSHLIYVTDKFTSSPSAILTNQRAIFAKDVQIGDALLLVEGSRVYASKVARMTITTRKGWFAPLTEEGTIIVDDVMTSCYAVVNSDIVAHVVYSPFRWFEFLKHRYLTPPEPLPSRSGPSRSGCCSSPEQTTASATGVHWYARFLIRIAPYVLPDHMLFSV
ncbi:sonic hedgehog protein-like [Tubulanus polymorphus]|uniref:sonic hedgehog protein-like n=1 Tax=Tubulanus polymorphus TaxID=672921 RepID=UPI003DA63D2A